jgi:hypothetical protein
MGSPLFAISELFIVVAAIWCSLKLAKQGMWFAVVGCAVLGGIAAIGAYRYGFNQVAALASLHKGTSQLGGAIALILIGVQFLRTFPLMRQSLIAKVSVSLAILGSVYTVVTFPKIGMGLIAVWMLVPIVATILITHESVTTRLYLAGLVSIFLVNFLFVRQSPLLGPIYSWHVYHTLISIWLIALVYVLKRNSQRIQHP